MPSIIRVDMTQTDEIVPSSVDFTLDWFCNSQFGRQMSWHFEPTRDSTWHFNWDVLEESYIFILIASGWKAADGKAGIQPFGANGPIGGQWIVDVPGKRARKIALLFPRTYLGGVGPTPGPSPGPGGQDGWDVGLWDTEPWDGAVTPPTPGQGGWNVGTWNNAIWNSTGSGGSTNGGGGTGGNGGGYVGGDGLNGTYSVCTGITFSMNISGDIMVFLL